MATKEKQPLEKIRRFVKDRYSNNRHDDLLFHSFEFDQKNIAAARMIAGHYQLSEGDRFVLYAAIWLKHIGYTEDPRDPETSGLTVAENFLHDLSLDEQVPGLIVKLLTINPTSQQPENPIGEIFLDATTSFLGKKSFLKMNELQRKEESRLTYRKIGKTEWVQQWISRMEEHKYYTTVARTLMEDKKQRNLTLLKNQLPEMNTRLNAEVTDHTQGHSLNLLKKDKAFQEKGIDTLFRIALSNNQRISGLADTKARILITVNAIILSAIISLILKKLDEEPCLSLPTFTLITVSLVTIVLAILAIRPHNSPGKFNLEELESNDINLLFFGNFYKMDLPDFRFAMHRVLKDNELIYGALIQDMYGQGQAVGRKYRLLRIAYTIFMFGLTISTIAFVIATIVHYQFSPSLHASASLSK
jgi:hypothetical protein